MVEGWLPRRHRVGTSVRSSVELRSPALCPCRKIKAVLAVRRNHKIALATSSDLVSCTGQSARHIEPQMFMRPGQVRDEENLFPVSRSTPTDPTLRVENEIFQRDRLRRRIGLVIATHPALVNTLLRGRQGFSASCR